MAAFANISLTDGKATPIVHTFSSNRISGDGVAQWVDRSGGIPIGYPKLTASLVEPDKSSPSYRQITKFTLPVLDVTAASTMTGIYPAPTIAHNIFFELKVSQNQRSLLADRKDGLAMFRSWVNSATFASMVLDNEFVS
jgi:hypothetical protein